MIINSLKEKSSTTSKEKKIIIQYILFDLDSLLVAFEAFGQIGTNFGPRFFKKSKHVII